MKTILRFEKIKDFNSINKAEYHHFRFSKVLNAASDKTNLVLIGNGSYESRINEVIKCKNIKLRKNSVIAMDCIMSLSPEFFVSENSIEDFSKRVKDFINEEFGDNCVSAVLHLDEKTPHVHAVIFPIIKSNGNFRLSARTLFDKYNLSRLQASYNNHFKDLGLTYKRGSRAKHKDIKQYYTEVNEYLAGKERIKKYIRKLKSDRLRYLELCKRLSYKFKNSESCRLKSIETCNEIKEENNRLEEELETIKNKIIKTIEVVYMKMKKYRSIEEMLKIEEIEKIIDYESALDQLRYEIANNLESSDSEKEFDHLGVKNKPKRKKGMF